MATLFPKTITYRRYSVTDDGYGRFTKAYTTATFQGSVQPMTGKEVESLEVGRRDLGKRKIYSSEKLKVAVEATAFSGDVVEWQDDLYEIIQEMTFQNDLIGHYKYVAEYRSAAEVARA